MSNLFKASGEVFFHIFRGCFDGNGKSEKHEFGEIGIGETRFEAMEVCEIDNSEKGGFGEVGFEVPK